MPIATVEDLRTAQRVLCYGVTGAGKSTAARELGSRLGLPVHLVDDEVGWLPGWTERPVPEQREIVARLVSGDRWVLDSAYGHWRDLVMPRTQVVLALDLPRWLSLARLLRRSLHRVLTGEEQCNGNVESWRQLLSGESILLWHCRSFANKRRRMRDMEAAPDGPLVLRVRSARELHQVLASLG